MDIVVKELTKVYRTQIALQNVNCTFKSCQIHGIVGRNGSGKSVLLRCICGYTKPTSGKIIIDGKELGKEMQLTSQMGLLLDTPLFLTRFSGYDNLEMLIGIRNHNKCERAALIEDALVKVGLADQRKKKVSQYSLGMRQRLGIAQAIMEKPSLLIMDEPFNGLDRDGVGEIRKLLKQLRNDGATILITSHYPEDLNDLCDTFTHLDGGKVVSVI